MSRFITSFLPTATRWLGGGLLLILFTACNIFDAEVEIAKEARVLVTGTAPEPLELVTSTKFTRSFPSEGGVILSLAFADTTFLSLASPHDETYPIRPDRGFFVRLKNLSMEPATVSMQVYFDGELMYSQENVTLQEGSLEYSYVFENQNVVR